MRLLDVGCGSGSITLGLAAAVAPGEVVGLDVEATTVDFARTSAAEQGVTNARFKTGSAHALPFADASFDVVYACTLLMHLGEPLRALREFRRVLRPGGRVAIADQDAEGAIWVGTTAMNVLVRFWALHGSPGSARHLRGLLHEAGFSQVDITVDSVLRATPERLLLLAEDTVRMQQAPVFRATVLQQGWATEQDLDDMETELRAWAQRPDSLAMIPVFCALGLA